MRYLSSTILALAITLGSAGVTTSREADDPRILRCDAGLDRGIAVCNNMHEFQTVNWQKCMDYTLVTHRQCVMEVVEQMETVGG